MKAFEDKRVRVAAVLLGIIATVLLIYLLGAKTTLVVAGLVAFVFSAINWYFAGRYSREASNYQRNHEDYARLISLAARYAAVATIATSLGAGLLAIGLFW